MEDSEVLDWVRRQADGARYVFLCVHRRFYSRGGWFAQGTKGHNKLDRNSSAAVLRCGPNGRTICGGWNRDHYRRRYRRYRWRTASCFHTPR